MVKGTSSAMALAGAILLAISIASSAFSGCDSPSTSVAPSLGAASSAASTTAANAWSSAPPNGSSLTAASASALASAGGSASPASSASSNSPTAEPLRYLVLGDSHVFGSFGTALDDALRASPTRKAWLYGSCGSSPLTWLRGMETPCGGLEHPDGGALHKTFEKYRTPLLGELLSTIRPHHTLVVMGVNFLRFAEESAPNIRLLIDALEKAGTTCTWVGPPEIPDRTSPDGAQVKAHKIMERLYRVLKSETDGRCTLLDARTIGVRRWDTPDYIHVGPVAAQRWSEAVLKSVDETRAKAEAKSAIDKENTEHADTTSAPAQTP